MAPSSQPAVQDSARSPAYFDLGPIGFLVRMWRKRPIILLVALGGGALALGVSFVVSPVYDATVTMLPQRSQTPTGTLGQFAGLAGIPLVGTEDYEELYREIVLSDRVLDTVLDRKWPTSTSNDSVSIFAALRQGVNKDNTRKGLQSAQRMKKRLRLHIIDFSRDKLSGFMLLRVSFPRDPLLAAALANHLAQELDRCNQNLNHAHASGQRVFVEERLRACALELSASESTLTNFVAANRAYALSPGLTQQYTQLAREVRAQEAVWLELRRQLELARIEEHKRLVTVTILDPAAVPTERAAPDRLRYLLAGVLAGVVAASAGLVLCEQFRIAAGRVSSS